MKYERKLSHVIYDHKYHVCWITKYRFQMLTGKVADRARQIIKQICKENDVEIIQGHIRPEHIHLVISIPPQISESKLMQYIKRKTARKLLQEFEILKKRYYGGSFWARGYYSATSGNVTDEMIINYVKHQGREKEQDDNFIISNYDA